MIKIRSRSRSRSSSSSGSGSKSSSNSERALVPVPMPDPDSSLASMFLARLHETNAARSDKNDSIVYADNLPQNVTKEDFTTILIKSMKVLGLLVRPGNPLLEVWKPKNKNFVMMDFRCVEEANNILLLNGMMYKGQELKISRPKHYTGSQPTSVTSMNCLFGNYALKNSKKRSLDDIAASDDKPEKKIDPPSRVLCLKSIVIKADMQNEAEYQDIFDDIRCECAKYGKIESMAMPKPGEKGAGNTYVAYDTVEQAMNARRSICAKRFNGKLVEATFHPEVMFLERDFRETWELRALYSS